MPRSTLKTKYMNSFVKAMLLLLQMQDMERGGHILPDARKMGGKNG